MIFRPEDFASKASNDVNRFGYIIQVSDAVETANRILDSYIATLPVVYGKYNYGYPALFTGNHDVNGNDTHQALLWDVKLIAKQCEHTRVLKPRDSQYGFCEDCETRLKATWSPA